MSHPLDRPVWTALTTRHAPLSQGGALAKRYDPSVVPFAAAIDNNPDSVRALASIAAPGESVLFAQKDDIVLPPELALTTTADGVQMIAQAQTERVFDGRIEQLTDADAAEMLALAALTKPGPFSLRAQALGSFFGIRIDGRLVAMAGERMKQPGLTELSGVCSHPDFRGHGQARLLSLYVAGRIFDRGETPYLHAYATNASAIRLYESIGFTLRIMINVGMARRQG
jgi:predicted GNAT family acetyltransferase